MARTKWSGSLIDEPSPGLRERSSRSAVDGDRDFRCSINSSSAGGKEELGLAKRKAGGTDVVYHRMK